MMNPVETSCYILKITLIILKANTALQAVFRHSVLFSYIFLLIYIFVLYYCTIITVII